VSPLAALLLRGVVLGLAIAAPVGPIGLLCIRRTLADGRRIGFVSGLGAATADGLYGAVAAFGLSAVTSALVAAQTPLRLVGGLFLVYLGVRTFRSRPAERAADAPATGNLAGAYASTFLLTITNPMTILSFAAIFAGAGLGAATGGTSAALLVLGVFLGSALWWLLLSSTVGLLHARVTPVTLAWVNRACGLALCTFGLLALAAAFAARGR
jgi:threonine/homoserine/homoserine lactone efflux protein